MGCRSRRSARRQARSRVLPPGRSRRSSALRTTTRRSGCGARAAAGPCPRRTARRRRPTPATSLGRGRTRTRGSVASAQLRVLHAADPGNRPEGVDRAVRSRRVGSLPALPEEQLVAGPRLVARSWRQVGRRQVDRAAGSRWLHVRQWMGWTDHDPGSVGVTADLMPAVGWGRPSGLPQPRPWRCRRARSRLNGGEESRKERGSNEGAACT